MNSIHARRPAALLALSLAFAPLQAQESTPEAAPAPADAAPAATQAPTPASTSARSESMRLAASHALILDFAEADSRAIAVGERGQVLLSESRSDWRQVRDVPTRANLNAVDAVGDKVWAVGHDGTILHSADGGQSWVVQRSDPWRPLGDEDMFDPRQGVPLLDVLMLDAQNGFAIGAYSLMLRTRDGGTTWEPVDVLASAGGAAAEPEDEPAAAEVEATDETAPAEAAEGDDWNFDQSDLELEEETDPHLNAIARTGDGSLFIVAERGAAFRSRDGGESWERLQLPYEGSMFGVLGYEGARVLAFGMRGNALESPDLGASWTALETGTELSLMGGAALQSGGAVLVGANGVVLVRPTADAAFALHTYQTPAQETPVLSGVLAQSASALVVGGDKGVGQFQTQAR